MSDPLTYGVTSMAGNLRSVAMRRPGAIFDADPIRWHYTKAIDATALGDQFDTFVRLVEEAGVEIMWMDDDADDLADSIFTYDPSFVIGEGAILLRPGKPLREGEVDVHRRFYETTMPVLGAIEAPGLMEGGDCFWLDANTLAVGRGFRTNQAGIDQFIELVEPHGVNVEVYDLPYHQGPDACLHLLSVVSPLDHDLALVHAPLMPTALYQRMIDAGYELLVAPPEEFEASRGLNLNVLATGPRACIGIDGFPSTTALMREAGCDVTVFTADELCIPCEGGPTCLTRPLHRS
jgi:N-dimethylarginine dimethylaminohydrolase